MTVLVGIHCSDGVVIGADSSSTFAAGPGRNTIEQPSEKITVIDGKLIIAGTGAVGLSQRYCAAVESSWRDRKLVGKSPTDFGKALCQIGLIDFEQTGVKLGNVPFGALVAFPTRVGAQLCELEYGSFQPELKSGLWYVSMGGGQSVTDPLLGLMRRAFWKDGRPTVEDGIFAVMWALEHAIRLNTGGVNGPPRVAVLRGDSASMLDEERLREHEQNVEAIYDYIGRFPEELRRPGTASTPPMPIPPP